MKPDKEVLSLPLSETQINRRCRMASQIVNGPSLLDLVLSLLEGDMKIRKQVIFTLAGGVTFNLFVNGLVREDGSGESWIINGYEPGHVAPVRMYYRTDRRTGVVFE